MDSLWKKTKKHTQRQIVSFTLLTKVFILVKSWRGAIRDFREYTKWKCGFGYPGVEIIYWIAWFYFLWSPVTQWPRCGKAPLPWSEKSNNACSRPGTLLVSARLSPRNELCALWRGTSLEVPCQLLPRGCICCPGYKESKHVMCCYVKGKGGQ